MRDPWQYGPADVDREEARDAARYTEEPDDPDRPTAADELVDLEHPRFALDPTDDPWHPDHHHDPTALGLAEQPPPF